MSKAAIVISLLYVTLVCHAQNSTLEPNFVALIVIDIDTSVQWYSNTLGFSEIDRVSSKEKGFKQSNLQRGNVRIELVELDNAISPKAIVPGYDAQTRMIGFFKVGFLVTDFEKWAVDLKEKKFEFYGDVVKDDLTGKRMMIALDPDGNRIQIFEK